MNKRAQFFIIAALILSGVILTFGKVYTSSKIETSNVQVYDLSNQIQYEASQVIDNGIYNSQDQNFVKSNLKNLTKYYSKLNPDSDIDIIFGNSSDISLIEYNLTSDTSLENSLSTSDIISQSNPDTAFKLENNQIKVKIKTPDRKVNSVSPTKEVEHDLTVDGDKVFYIVVRKKVNDQDVIIYR